MNVAPGSAYTSRLALGVAQTGLAGTVRYRLLDNDTTVDDPVYGPSTSGIIEDPTGTGSYLFHGTAPTIESVYERVWDTGVGTDLVYDDDLVVTYSLATAVGATGRDLCSLTDVTALVPGYTAGDDTNTDATLQELIHEQSRDGMERCGREFKAVESSQPATRSFDFTDTTWRRRKVFLGDVASVSSIATVDSQGNAIETVSSANYVLLPRVREDWQPYWGVWFPPNTATPTNIYPGYVMNVSATWGFPSVPTTVKDAVARLVIVRYLNDVTNQGTQFADAADRVQFNIAGSIRQALDALDRFYVPAF